MRTTHLRRFGLLAVVVAATAGSGCSTMNNTEKGAVGGGIFGTAAGTAIGAATGRPLLGAAVGGLAGTATGALVGNEVDKDEAKKREIIHAQQLADAQAAGSRMGITDVIEMTKAGHDPQVIINQIRATRSTFPVLSAADLNLLKANGVADRVIAEMQVARGTPPRTVVVQEPAPVVYDSPSVYVRPAPVVVVGGPPRYYYGGGYYYRRW